MIEPVQITIGAGGAFAIAAACIRYGILPFKKKSGDTHEKATLSLESGIQMLRTAVAHIEAAVADLPRMRDAQDRIDIDVRVLKTTTHRLDADVSDLRRENEDRDMRIRRLESGRS